MKQSTLLLSFVTLALLASAPSSAQSNFISASDAANNVGTTVMVCGKVASATYASNSRGKPTFLNLDKAYPNHIFTAVIFDDYRNNFDYPPESLKGKNICVHGLVEQYKGKPQIKVRRPDQITKH